MKSKVLITDDNPEMRLLLRLSLASENIEIYEANTGEAGLETAMRVRPQLILMDVRMPGGVSGLQACRTIKSFPEMADTVVIIVSACGQRSDITEGKSAGADEYIVKPFSPTKLRETVGSYLAH